MKELDSRSGGTRDQFEVCLDDTGLLRRGQVIWLGSNRCAIIVTHNYLYNKEQKPLFHHYHSLTRALQSHDLSGEEISSGTHYILF